MNLSRSVWAIAAPLDQLEPRLLLSGLDPTVYAQYMLELVNRARANPAAEAARYNIDLNEGLAPDTILPDAKQPLAFNPFLMQSAVDHTQWMIDNNLFGHDETPGVITPMDRMRAAGYAFTPPAGSAENIGWIGVNPPALPDIIATTAQMHEALFVDTTVADRGHRINLMDPDLQEIGIGVLSAPFQGFNSLVVTQDFAFQKQSFFITGVAFDDRLVLRDEFYTPGEGLADITVTAVSHDAVPKTFTTTTFVSGGFGLQVPAGTYDVQFSGGSLTGVLVTSNVIVTNQNVKVDLPLANPTSQADLIVVPAKSSTTTVFATPGATVTFSVSVRNIGTGKLSSPVSVSTFLSDAKPLTVADTQVDSYVIRSLNSGATNTQSRTFTAPVQEGTYYFATRVDSGDELAEPNESNNWGSVFTLIVGQPDLIPTFTKITLPDIIVPGDKGSVSVGITNAGTIPGATGDIEIFASQDPAPHEPTADDVVLATVPAGKTVIGPGASKTITAKVNITDAMSQGDWYILVDADANDAVPESDETNNIFATAEARPLVWQFGTFDDRQNVHLVVHDSQDTLVTFSMSGGGWGEVQGDAAFTDIILNDTTVKSAMTVTSDGPTTTAGNLTALGSMKSISAAKLDITGNVDIAGSIATLKLGDMAADTAITLHSDALIAIDPATQATMTLGFVGNCVLTANDEPIKSLTVIEWQGGGAPGNSLSALALGTLSVRGQTASIKKGLAFSAGNFDAAVNVDGAIRTVKVAGTLSGQWNALSVHSLSVGADIADLTMTLTGPVDSKVQDLSSLTVKGWIRQSRILSGGNIGSVTAGGLWDADIFAAVIGNPPATGLPDPATDFLAQAAIKSVTVKGTVDDGSGFSTINTNIAASALGKVSLRNALADNASTPWGLAAHTLASYSYRDADTRYSWKPSDGGVPNQPAGDFTVRLV